MTHFRTGERNLYLCRGLQRHARKVESWAAVSRTLRMEKRWPQGMGGGGGWATSWPPLGAVSSVSL